jgi:DNA primase
MGFIDYLHYKFDKVETAGSGREYRVDCFNCDDRKGHLYINPAKGKAKCHRCGKSYGNIPFFIMDVEHGNMRKVKEVMEDFNINEKDLDMELDDIPASKIEMPECHRVFKDDENPIGQRAYNYLSKKRGLTDYDIRFFGLHYCRYGRYANCIIIPVIENGVPVYFSARSFNDKAKMQKLFPTKQEVGYGKANVVFNLNYASDSDMIVVTEGPFDAMKVGRSGVAIFGKSLSEVQRQKIISSNPAEVVIMLDPDAHNDTMAVAKIFNSYSIKTSYILLEGKDPGDRKRQQLQEILEKRVRYNELDALEREAMAVLDPWTK